MAAPIGERQRIENSFDDQSFADAAYLPENELHAPAPIPPLPRNFQPVGSPERDLDADPNSAASVVARLRQKATSANSTSSAAPYPTPSYATPSAGYDLVVAPDPYEDQLGGSHSSQRSITKGHEPDQQRQPDTYAGPMMIEDQYRRKIAALKTKLEAHVRELEGPAQQQIAGLNRFLVPARKELESLIGNRDAWLKEFDEGVERTKTALKEEATAKVRAERALHAERSQTAIRAYGEADEYVQVIVQPQLERLNQILTGKLRQIKADHSNELTTFTRDAAEEREKTEYKYESAIKSLQQRIEAATEELANVQQATAGQVAKRRAEIEAKHIKPLQDKLGYILALKASRNPLKQREYRRLNGGRAAGAAPSRQVGAASRQPQLERPATRPDSGSTAASQSSSQSRLHAGAHKPERKLYKRPKVILIGSVAVTAAIYGVTTGVNYFKGGTANESQYVPASIRQWVPAIDKAIQDIDIAIPMTDKNGHQENFNPMAGNTLLPKDDYDPILNPGHTYRNAIIAMMMVSSGGDRNYTGQVGPTTTDTVKITYGLVPMKTSDAIQTASDMGIGNKFKADGSSDPQTEMDIAEGQFNTYAKQLEDDPKARARYADKDKNKAMKAFYTDEYTLFGYSGPTLDKLVQMSVDWDTKIGPSVTASKLMGDEKMKQIYAEANTNK